jgi:hypothetical protein
MVPHLRKGDNGNRKRPDRVCKADTCATDGDCVPAKRGPVNGALVNLAAVIYFPVKESIAHYNGTS